MKKICVFCGSSNNVDSKYLESAFELGKDLAKNNIALVYGGASVGVMGAVADGVLEASGKVYGVIPKAIVDLEVAHEGLTELHVVDSMHVRKQKMYDLSDAFFTLPGGLGTLDELCEILTWAQLHYHHKPCYLINYQGFYDAFLEHLAKTCNVGFMRKEHLELIRVFTSGEGAIEDFLTKY